MVATARRNTRHEHPLLMNRRLDVATAAVLTVVTVALFALVWFPSSRSSVQRVDDAFLRTMVSVRTPLLTSVADVLNVLGSVWVTLPVRAAVVLFLAVRRRWWHAAAFLGAMVLSEVAIGGLKRAYDRPRPPAALVETSGGSFPSGHAVAASVTAVALVIALFPPAGFRRWLWGAAAALFSFVMALSRAYLGAHWLSDATAGVLLGTTIALGTAVVVEILRSRVEGPTADRLHPVGHRLGM
jgi:membrane-associated phospholipid phosphatase